MVATPKPRAPARRRPPHVACVVPHEEALRLADPVDWSTWHLTDEGDMGESPEQAEIIALFKDILQQLAATDPWGQGKYIGTDAFFGWLAEHPLVRVSPDIYVLPAEPPRPLPGSFQTWRPGHHAPLLAVEIVSDDWRKDYELNPQKYALLGVQELVIFDPRPAADKPNGERVRLQVFRWTEDGAFASVYRGRGPLPLLTVPASVVLVDTPRGARLRLSREGALLPTSAERAEAERQRAETERQHAEAERQRAEAERQRAEAERQRAEAEHQRAEAESQRAEAALRELTELKARLAKG